MNTIVTSDKDEVQIINWLKSACSKEEERSVLTAIYTDDDHSISCDGHRLHIANDIPSILSKFVDNLIRLKTKITKNKLVEYEEEEGTFPDYNVLIPTNEPKFRIAVNANYLIDALQLSKVKDQVDAMVILEFHSDTSPFVIKMKRGKAVIMPMDINQAK